KSAEGIHSGRVIVGCVVLVKWVRFNEDSGAGQTSFICSQEVPMSNLTQHFTVKVAQLICPVLVSVVDPNGPKPVWFQLGVVPIVEVASFQPHFVTNIVSFWLHCF